MAKYSHTLHLSTRWLACLLAPSVAWGQSATEAPAEQSLEREEELARVYIREFRVLGTKELPKIDVEATVYPFLGPGRTFKDVEAAAEALTKAYHAKGYSLAQVVIPEQDARSGVVTLQAYEGKVGSLRITGARYFLPSRIRAQAKSMAAGKIINYNDVGADMVKLSKFADMRVTPKTPIMTEPGVYDLELEVKDNSPLHGSAELNNRASLNTTDTRMNVSFSYANLWQRGHSIGGGFQFTPENFDEVRILNGFYIWRSQEWEYFSLQFSASKQHTHTTTPTVSGAAAGSGSVVSPGHTLGVRALFDLPSADGFFHTMSFGFDYKALDSEPTLTAKTSARYYPINISWDGTWVHSRKESDPSPEEPDKTKSVETGTTTLALGLTFGPRGFGSDVEEFNNNRFGTDGSFAYIRGTLEHVHNLKRDWQLLGRVQGQASDGPLLNYEQFSAGGMTTVRGYLEGEALGDNALLGTLELRSPSLLKTTRTVGSGPTASEESTGKEWRLYAFADGGWVTLQKALPEQISSFRLAGIGVGSEIHLWDHLHGVLELSLPLTSYETKLLPGVESSNTKAHDPRVNFRLWSDF